MVVVVAIEVVVVVLVLSVVPCWGEVGEASGTVPVLRRGQREAVSQPASQASQPVSQQATLLSFTHTYHFLQSLDSVPPLCFRGLATDQHLGLSCSSTSFISGLEQRIITDAKITPCALVSYCFV